MIVNIIDDEVVENRQQFYIGLTTNDTRIEILSVRQQQTLQWVCINDNDCKFVDMIYTALFIIISIKIGVSIVLTVIGLTTNIYENNGSVQACVNITQGYLEAHSAYIWYSTSSGSAIGIQYQFS